MNGIRPIFKETTLSRKTGSWRDPELKQKPGYLTKSEIIAPCKTACPLENEIPHWIFLLKDGKYREAWEKLIEKNPLPAVTGRVCQAFCEDKCNRKEFDQSLSIRELEKYLGDKALAENWRIPLLNRGAQEFSVAVVGSGPCGLSCVYHLARQGYQVVIFESLPVLGGMLRVGIPDFRLPKDVLEKEINNILSIGTNLVWVCGGARIDLEMLESIKRGYDAVFLAVGLQRPRRLNIEGEENPNVLYGLDFLKSASFRDEARLGRRVIVIGGGNTAIDVARTAKRFGSHVIIFYRRTKAEMPAIKEEVVMAQTEGIEIQELVLPIKILDGFIEFQRVKTGLVPVEGSNFLEKFDKIIIAAGEEKEEIPGASNGNKIFIAEDTANVPAAINSGRLGAEAIDYFLRTGQRMESQLSQLKIVGFNDINTAYFKRQKRSKAPRPEAKRCFSCGFCRECENCFNFCPEPAIKKTGDPKKPYVIDYNYCKGCGICAKECPRGVIVMEEENESK